MQLKPNHDTRNVVLHGVAALAGLVLVVAPWLAGFAGLAAAMWNAVLVGGAIAILGIAVILRDIPYHAYGHLALGLWAMASPWILGFSVLTGALYAHLGVGLVTALVGAVTLWLSGHRPLSEA